MPIHSLGIESASPRDLFEMYCRFFIRSFISHGECFVALIAGAAGKSRLLFLTQRKDERKVTRAARVWVRGHRPDKISSRVVRPRVYRLDQINPCASVAHKTRRNRDLQRRMDCWSLSSLESSPKTQISGSPFCLNWRTESTLREDSSLECRPRLQYCTRHSLICSTKRDWPIEQTLVRMHIFYLRHTHTKWVRSPQSFCLAESRITRRPCVCILDMQCQMEKVLCLLWTLSLFLL